MLESVRWLLSRDHFAEARDAAALQLGVRPESLPMPMGNKQPALPVPLRELLRYRRAFRLIVITWLGMSTTTYGYQLWAPTILAMVMKIPVKAVAGYFIIVAISGTIGRFVFSALPLFIGRRHSGEVMGWGAAESYPVRLAARSTGLAQAANGVGKMLGPAGLGLIAGTANVINPQATESAVLPAFLFLAAQVIPDLKP